MQTQTHNLMDRTHRPDAEGVSTVVMDSGLAIRDTDIDAEISSAFPYRPHAMKCVDGEARYVAGEFGCTAAHSCMIWKFSAKQRKKRRAS
jgi:hypothetical protein